MALFKQPYIAWKLFERYVLASAKLYTLDKVINYIKSHVLTFHYMKAKLM